MEDLIYKLKPIYDLSDPVDVECDMYKLKPVHSFDKEEGSKKKEEEVVKELGPSASSSSSSFVEDLEKRQESILNRLNALKSQISDYKVSIGLPPVPTNITHQGGSRIDLVVNANPSHPPYSLLLVYHQLSCHGLKIFTSCHLHSSVLSLPEHLQDFLPSSPDDLSRTQSDLCMTLIWKSSVGTDPETVISPLDNTIIRGEVNILRFVARSFPLIFDDYSEKNVDKTDYLLDLIHSDLVWRDNNKESVKTLKILESQLTGEDSSPFFSGKPEDPGLADLAAWSAITRDAHLNHSHFNLSANLRKWLTACNKICAFSGSRRHNGRQSGRRPSGGAQKRRGSSNRRRQSSSNKKKRTASTSKEANKENNSSSSNSNSNNKTNRNGNRLNNRNRKRTNSHNKHKTQQQQQQQQQQQNNGKEAFEFGAHCSEKLFQMFKELNIEYSTVEHPDVFTVETMMPHLKTVQGSVGKNLFLKDKKKNLYLLSTLHDRQVNLKDISKELKAKELRFADSETLFSILGVTQGCVTPYALINDDDDAKDKKVICAIDSDLLKASHVHFHPLVNSATTGISSDDFLKFLKHTGHEPVIINF